MLIVTNKPIMPSVVMLNVVMPRVIMLSVVAPFYRLVQFKGKAGVNLQNGEQ